MNSDVLTFPSVYCAVYCDLSCVVSKSCYYNFHMDLGKASDCVVHEILLTILKRYSVHSTPLRWISSYLSQREHFVSWNQIQSTSWNLNTGVLQGSILGSFSFWSTSMILSTRVLSCLLYFLPTTQRNMFKMNLYRHIADRAIENFNTESLPTYCRQSNRKP